MIWDGWTWSKPPTPRPSYVPPTAPERVTYASHIRGKVRKVGSTWRMTVENGNTGDVLASDNTGAWGPMLTAADMTTGAVRKAWMYDFGNKAVRA